MEAAQNIQARFGPDAAKAISGLIGSPPVGMSDLQPAPKDRSRGSLIGAVVGEALGEPVEDRPRNWIVANPVQSPATSSRTQRPARTPS